MPEVERGIRRSLRRNALVARGLVFLDAITQGPISDEDATAGDVMSRRFAARDIALVVFQKDSLTRTARNDQRQQHDDMNSHLSSPPGVGHIARR
jgi:hypothetical protein